MDIARETALKILYKIDEEKAYSNIVLNSEIKKQRAVLQTLPLVKLFQSCCKQELNDCRILITKL